MKLCVLGVISCLVVCLQGHEPPMSPFDRAVEQLQQERPDLFAVCHTRDANEEYVGKESGQKRYTPYQKVNRAAFLYALCRAAYAYRHIYWLHAGGMGDASQVFVRRGAHWILGASLSQSMDLLGKHVVFGYAVGRIALEVLFYKTIINIVIYCGQSDFFGLMGIGGKK